MKNRQVVWLLLVGLAPALTMAQSSLALAQGPFADVPSGHPAEAALDELAKQGLVNGYPDGTYCGNRAMTRYEVAMAAMRIMQMPLRRDPATRFWPIQPIPGPPLKDVPEGHWAADAVASLRKWGILAGYPDGTFAGDRVMTRGEFALVLRRLHEFIIRLVDLELEQRRKDTAPVPSAP
jgi:S-layer family protein